jgi:hypothetical protein
VSEPCREVRAITALTVSTDHKWLAVAEDMVGTRPPQVREICREGGRLREDGTDSQTDSKGGNQPAHQQIQ